MSEKRLRIKELILQAAKELLHENGYNRLSLRAIAQRAGFAPASLYEYFTGKDDIIDTLCMDIDRQLAESCGNSLNIVEASLIYIQFALTQSDDFQLLYQRALLPEQTEYTPEVFRKIAAHHPVADSDLLATAFWSTAHGLALLSLHRDVDATQHEAILEKLLQGFML